MAGESFQTLDVSSVRRMLSRLHDEVVRGNGRIEITRRGCKETCIMISKAELDGLERAIEILSDGEGVKTLCASLTSLASAANGTPTAA